MRTRKIIACVSALLLSATVSMAEWGKMVGRPELDDWIKKALMDSPAIEMARERLAVSGMSVRSARADGRPSLDADLTARGGQEVTIMSDGKTEDVEPFAVGAEASWEIDVFGRLRSEVGAARFAETASEYVMQDRELDLASEIVIRYLEGTYRTEQGRLQDSIVKSNADAVGTIKGRVEAGLLSSQELDGGEAELKSAELARTSVREAGALVAARWTYLVSTNGVPMLKDAVAKNLPALPKLPAAGSLHAYAVNRPDVRAAYALWQQADSRTAAVSRRRMPSVEAVASAEGVGPSPVEEPERWSAWAGVRISLPVIAPKEGADVEIEKAKARMEWALYDEVTRRALLDIREAYVRRLHAEKKLGSARAAADRLKSRFESEERKYKSGLIKRPELERARLSWLKAQDSALAFHAAVLEQHIRFIRACGGPEGHSSSQEGR